MTNTTIPAGYKQTEVGIIPEDWQVRSLVSLGSKSIPAIKSGPFGSSITKDTYCQSGYKVYGQEQVIRGDHNYGDYFIDLQKYRSLQSCAVKPGDILLSLVGTIGKVLVVPNDAKEGIINPRLIRFSFDKNIVVPEFFKELFESDYIKECLSKAVQGGTMGVLNAGMLNPLVIALPRFVEQTAIATVLSDVDALIASLNAQIAKKRDIKTATMQQLLTGKQRLAGFGEGKGMKPSELGEIPEDWEVVKIGEVLSVTTGSKNTQDNQHSGEYPFFVRSQTVERINSYSFDCEAVLTAGDGVGTGKIFHYINGKFDVHQRVYVMSSFSERLVGKYFYLYFSNFFYDRISMMTAKSSVDSVRREMIADMQILLPFYKEQGAIAGVLSAMDEDIAALEQRLAKTKALKQGMMQELLTGRTRLV